MLRVNNILNSMVKMGITTKDQLSGYDVYM